MAGGAGASQRGRDRKGHNVWYGKGVSHPWEQQVASSTLPHLPVSSYPLPSHRRVLPLPFTSSCNEENVRAKRACLYLCSIRAGGCYLGGQVWARGRNSLLQTRHVSTSFSPIIDILFSSPNMALRTSPTITALFPFPSKASKRQIRHHQGVSF